MPATRAKKDAVGPPSSIALSANTTEDDAPVATRTAAIACRCCFSIAKVVLSTRRDDAPFRIVTVTTPSMVNPCGCANTHESITTDDAASTATSIMVVATRRSAMLSPTPRTRLIDPVVFTSANEMLRTLVSVSGGGMRTVTESAAPMATKPVIVTFCVTRRTVIRRSSMTRAVLPLAASSTAIETLLSTMLRAPLSGCEKFCVSLYTAYI